MAVIPIHDNKNIETKDLEVHVVMCEYRRKTMEEKIENLESEIDQVSEKLSASKRLFLSSIVSVVTGVTTTIFSVILNYNFLKS